MARSGASASRARSRVDPRFLLLDEPAAGLAPAEAEELRDVDRRSIRDRHGCGILVIEHNMALVMSLCDRIHVLDGGRTIAAGTAGRDPGRPGGAHAPISARTALQ